MAGFFKTLFGKGKKAADEPRADDTKKASEVAESGARVVPEPSAPKDSVRKNKRAAEDPGPWFVGKTVAEIFEIRGVLGRGGMGIVYRAFDTATHRDVAVKVPLGKFVDDETLRKDVAREAESWSALIHPHIVHAFDFHDDETTDYRPAIFMDYCDGGSLADRLHNGGHLSIPDALDIAIQVSWAMEFAHQKGLIHRDLKPGNVLLISDGKALVSDLGLVKQIDLEDLGVSEGELKQQDGELLATITRGAAGTPEYMPPEQWEGNACPQSDIYAFGIMLYELLCGCRPFSAKRRADLRGVHGTVPPPNPKRLNGQIPDVLAELMIECLAKEPTDRPAGFDRVAGMLIAAYEQVDKEGRAYGHRRKRPDAKDISQADKKAHAWSLVRIGIGCELRGDLTEAYRCYAKALNVFQALDDRAKMGGCYTNMGNLAYARGNYEEAMELIREDLAICERLGDQAGMGTCYNNMATVGEAVGDHAEMRRYARLAVQIKENIGAPVSDWLRQAAGA